MLASAKADYPEVSDSERQGAAGERPSPPAAPQAPKAEQNNPSRRMSYDYGQTSRPRGLESLSPSFNPELWNRFR